MNYNNGNVFFLSDFDDNMEANIVLPLTREIQRQKRLRDGRIDLYINSFGGYGHLVFHLIELVEIAKRENVIVRTIVPNVAFSAGSMIAVTGSPGERYIAKNAEHLIHYGHVMSTESTPKQIERWGSYKARDFKATIDLYKRFCDIPDLDNEMMDDGWIIPAPKCIKYRMADKYMEKFDIGEYESEPLSLGL